jgi:hypothetical protein
VLAQALAEALVLDQSEGVRRAALMEFINDSAIGSPFTRYKTDAYVALDLKTASTPKGSAKTCGSPSSSPPSTKSRCRSQRPPSHPARMPVTRRCQVIT